MYEDLDAATYFTPKGNAAQEAFIAEHGEFWRIGFRNSWFWLAVNPQILTTQAAITDWNKFVAARNAPVPQYAQDAFDTIGQTIPRTLGHCRLRLNIIWAGPIVEPTEEEAEAGKSPTRTLAGALCSPIDPEEDGEIFSIWDSGVLVKSEGGVVSPVGWSEADAEALANSINNAVVYPGDEAQLPAAIIVADKGASQTNAFRGIRYVILPDYPMRDAANGGIPDINIGINRPNDGGEPAGSDDGGLAVEFEAGEA